VKYKLEKFADKSLWLQNKYSKKMLDARGQDLENRHNCRSIKTVQTLKLVRKGMAPAALMESSVGARCCAR